jgi:hypothetical protein
MKTEEFDSSVSPAFQIVFKKMNKKDCTTKLKALQEFSDLIATSEAEAVKTILAFWATLYNILATDTDHRVREAVHNAHHQIILKDKKMIAPHLKQLVGPWFTSQYDNYPPAASAASKAFAVRLVPKSERFPSLVALFRPPSRKTRCRTAWFSARRRSSPTSTTI